MTGRRQRPEIARPADARGFGFRYDQSLCREAFKLLARALATNPQALGQRYCVCGSARFEFEEDPVGGRFHAGSGI
jgi:hypothetical protein